MIKRIFFIIALLALLNISVYGAGPDVYCNGLPGCESGETSENVGLGYISRITSLLIQFVAVFSVFSLIISGMMYMLSMGEEEKTSKAKKWIIWSLVAVFLSISAWGIIRLLNGLTL